MPENFGDPDINSCIKWAVFAHKPSLVLPKSFHSPEMTLRTHDFADLSAFRKNFGNFDFTPLDRGMASLDKWTADHEAIDMVNKAELERKKYLSKV